MLPSENYSQIDAFCVINVAHEVLELLNCETCGDLFLGGYKQQISEKPPSWYLSGDYQELTSLPEKGVRDRNYETYAIFWQRKQIPEPDRSWEKHGIKKAVGTRAFQACRRKTHTQFCELQRLFL